MIYNEYIAEQDKVLFNLKTFSYGNRIITKDDYGDYLIQISKEVAKEYIQLLKDKQEEYNNIQQENINESIMVMNDDGEYVEQPNHSKEEVIEKYRLELGGQLITKYGINKHFQTIIHNTEQNGNTNS